MVLVENKTTPCSVFVPAREDGRVAPGEGGARLGIDGIQDIVADEVALDQLPVLGLPLMSSWGTDTPTSKPLMIRPRSNECDASTTKPVGAG